MKLKQPNKAIDENLKRELEAAISQMEDSLKTASNTFRDDVVNLVNLSRYLRVVIAKPKAKSFLNQNYPDIMAKLEKIVNDPSLDV